MRNFSGSNKVLPKNVTEIDSNEGTDKQDKDGITCSAPSLTVSGRPLVFRIIITANDAAIEN